MKKLVVSTLIALCSSVSAQEYQYQKVFSGLSVPWGFDFVDASTLIVTERSGSLKRLNLTNGTSESLNAPNNVYSGGQGGLMDIKLQPGSSGQMFLTYSKKTNPGAVTTLVKGKLSQNNRIEWQQVLQTDSATNTSRHFGSRITFDDKGYLYMSVGDRGVRENGQDTSNHAGTILRLNADGTSPADNPFTDDAKVPDEIWSFGHRNPQGIFYDKRKKQLWSIEHGPRGGDEINLIKPGANYGWPVTSHGKEYWGPINVSDFKEKAGIESPLLVYIPSIAPSSLILYRGTKYPQLDGKLLSGALKLTHINVVSVSDSNVLKEEERLATDLNQRIRHIALSPDGFLYFSTDRGNIYRILPL
ncbi:PQQ-dependent sugar dehydrogenase [Vibrio sp. SCSIO 43137]|uniref:PQQ-dependent sugar dehydrogenase n=1 Tax=Vibrio sp. SCSIO 43137 TaxID=3021011 RepID=UPI002307E319|nr:PQQ-dependent sugar dehydrogenase [Vibrio sp. SCSIO 43137]WCE30988.1 PQQ-dependent sugar dehydrogenase [Vibrio sp. SCSIO 43137]